MALVMVNSNSTPAFERQLANPALHADLRPVQTGPGQRNKPPAEPQGRDGFAACAQHPGLLFFHAGGFNLELAQAAAQSVRQRLDELESPGHTKERLLRVFNELARQLARPGPDGAEPQGRIAVGSLGEHFWILCSRQVGPDQLTGLRAQLDTLRLMSADELADINTGRQGLEAATAMAEAFRPSPQHEVDSSWLQVACNSSAPIEYGFSRPLPDGGAQLHVRAWI